MPSAELANAHVFPRFERPIALRTVALVAEVAWCIIQIDGFGLQLEQTISYQIKIHHPWDEHGTRSEEA